MNELGTVAGERAATLALERLHDTGISASLEISGGPVCGDVTGIRSRFQEAMVESEPAADRGSRRTEGFGS